MRRAARPALARPGLAGEQGFALVEMLVAMVLLSLVGLTLARFQTFQLAGTASIAAASAARLEADNLAIDVLAAPAAPAAEASGTSFNAGREWAWTITPGPSPEPELMPDMVTVGISIRATPNGPVVAARQVMRPRLWNPLSQQGRRT
jgi:type II secretion system protein I